MIKPGLTIFPFFLLLVSYGCFGEEVPDAGNCSTRATAPAGAGDTGPFEVGHRIVDHTYIPPGATEARTIPVNIWYPTHDQYADVRLRYSPVHTDSFNIIPDATPAPALDDCGYPLMAFSHGHLGWGGINAHTMKRFASHGWVGVAPEHLGNTVDSNIDPRPAETYLIRPGDLSAAVDALDQLPADDPLAGKVATDRYVAMGHSFGVFTMWAVLGVQFNPDKVKDLCTDPVKTPETGCTQLQQDAFVQGFNDSRAVAAIPLDGGLSTDWIDVTATASVTKPIMLMTGEESFADAATEFADLQAPGLIWLEFEGGCHETFASGDEIFACDTFDGPLGQSITDTYALAFARKHLLGDEDSVLSGILSGNIEVNPLVNFSRK